MAQPQMGIIHNCFILSIVWGKSNIDVHLFFNNDLTYILSCTLSNQKTSNA